jgi:LmbE family N-acetylglucosaminyl deacetylase
LQSLSSRTNCTAGTSLDIVAHEDDDILFFNPDIQGDIAAGKCLRTMYITAGDAGGDATYWQGREAGAKAAYAAMYNVADNWTDKTELLNDRLITVSYLDNVPTVALTFLRLPDGNMHGEGFAVTNTESLAKLIGGEVPKLDTVDGRSTYSQDELVSTLGAVMQLDKPDYIRAQNPTGAADGDHADHAAAGTLTTLAAAMYATPHKLATYIGYPDTLLETNLTIDQIGAKQFIFLAYAQHDGAVCHTTDECAQNVSYGNFLTRQYRLSEAASGQ